MLAYHAGSVMRYLLETLHTVRYDPGYIGIAISYP